MFCKVGKPAWPGRGGQILFVWKAELRRERGRKREVLHVPNGFNNGLGLSQTEARNEEPLPGLWLGYRAPSTPQALSLTVPRHPRDPLVFKGRFQHRG